MKNCRCERQRHSSSVLCKASNCEIGGLEAADHLHETYFLQCDRLSEVTRVHGPTSAEKDLERRFRMQPVIYERVKSSRVSNDPFLQNGDGCTGKKLSPTDQEMVAALAQMCHRVGVAFLLMSSGCQNR